jgi:hypothetical protein
VLGTCGFAALLAISVSACGGGGPTASGTSPATSASAAAEPSATPSEPTAAADKAYTTAELEGIVRQVRDSADRRLTAVPAQELAATVQQSKDMISSIEVAPAECKELAASGTVPSLDGAAVAMGLSTDQQSGTVTALSLMSGLGPELLAKVSGPSDQLDKCSNMTMTAAGVEVAVSIPRLEGVSGVPGATAYRTDTTLPNGQVQSVTTAQGVHQGVVLTAVASGGAGGNAEEQAGALLDSAAALIK